VSRLNGTFESESMVVVPVAFAASAGYAALTRIVSTRLAHGYFGSSLVPRWLIVLAGVAPGLRARRETNESSASEERRNRIANALGATRARKAILGG
jgi:hypothetical protein